MTTTDTSEKGLEALIVRHLTSQPEPAGVPGQTAQLTPGHYAAGGYVQGQSADYNRDLALDVPKLLDFLNATQPKAVETLELKHDGIKRTQFLHRLQGEITRRGAWAAAT